MVVVVDRPVGGALPGPQREAPAQRVHQRVQRGGRERGQLLVPREDRVSGAGVVLLHPEEQFLDLPAVRLLDVGTLRDVRGQVGEVGVEGNLLLGDVPERFGAGDVVVLGAARALGRPLPGRLEGTQRGVVVVGHLRDVALEEVHQRRLGLVVQVVPGEEFVRAEFVGVAFEHVPAEDAAVGAGGHPLRVVLDDVVHPHAELLGVGDDLVAQVQIGGEFATGVDALVAVALDALVDRERDEFDPRVRGEGVVEDLRQDDRVLSAGETDHPGLGVVRSGVVGDEGVLADPAADPRSHRATEVRLTEMQSRVGGVHDRGLAALVAVHRPGLSGRAV